MADDKNPTNKKLFEINIKRFGQFSNFWFNYGL